MRTINALLTKEGTNRSRKAFLRNGKIFISQSPDAAITKNKKKRDPWKGLSFCTLIS